jgi:hypothetical protein
MHALVLLGSRKKIQSQIIGAQKNAASESGREKDLQKINFTATQKIFLRKVKEGLSD